MLPDVSNKKLTDHEIKAQSSPGHHTLPILCYCCRGKTKFAVFYMLLGIIAGMFLNILIALATVRAYHYDHRHIDHGQYDTLAGPDPSLDRFGQSTPHQSYTEQRPKAATQNPCKENFENNVYCNCSGQCASKLVMKVTNKQYEMLLKYNLDHYYGKRELALNVEAFIPSPKRHWNLDHRFEATARKLCAKNVKPLAVFFVLTMHAHFEERQAIRKTWGSVAHGEVWPFKRLAGEIRVVFLLGRSDINEENLSAAKEEREYGDIVIADFKESYENLTRKVLTGFRWVREYCPLAKHIVKVDEDTFLDVPRLLNILSSQDLRNFIYGPVSNNSVVVRLPYKTQEKPHKHAVSKNVYQPNYYPPHVKGNMYALCTELALRLLDIAEFFPYLHIEDAFITGILAKVYDIRHINIPENLYDRFVKFALDPCDFVSQKKLLAQHVYPTMAYNIWNRMKHPEMCGVFIPI